MTLLLPEYLQIVATSNRIQRISTITGTNLISLDRQWVVPGIRSFLYAFVLR